MVTRVSPFSVALDPNESMPAPSRRKVFFSGTMLTLACPFMFIYTWASIHTTSIFKTRTEVLSIVVHTSFRKTQSCLVCPLKARHSFSLTCKVKSGQILFAVSLTTSRSSAPPHLPVFSGLFWRGIPLCTNSRRPQLPQADRQNSCWLPRVLETLIWLYYGWICSR